jgi:DNA replication licensing factor MCM3
VADDDEDKENLKTPVYQKHDRLLHGDRKKGEKLLSIPFIKKYLLYTKTRIKPVLDEESQRRIIDAFADLRSREDTKTLPITARTLETMIRLSVAHAKSRLSTIVSLVRPRCCACASLTAATG